MLFRCNCSCCVSMLDASVCVAKLARSLGLSLESEMRALLSVAKVKDGRAGWVCEDGLLSVEWRPERNHPHKARAAETSARSPEVPWFVLAGCPNWCAAADGEIGGCKVSSGRPLARTALVAPCMAGNNHCVALRNV